MMKIPNKAVCILLALFAACLAYGQARIDPAREAAGVAIGVKMHPTQLCLKLRELPADEKQKLRNELKRVLADPEEMNRTGGSSDFETYLVALDDPETIARVVQTYREANGWGFQSALGFSANPSVIAMLGDDLLKDNTMRVFGDTGADGAASTAWAVIHRIIHSAPEFSEELKTWASGTKFLIFAEGPTDPTRRGGVDIAILREWWRANREAFQAGEFAKVKPGTPWPVREKPKINVYIPSGSQTAGGAANTPSGFAGPNAPVSSKATRDQSEAKSQSSTVLWIILAACAAVAAIVVILANRAVRRR